jgi:hypothetical protein
MLFQEDPYRQPHQSPSYDPNNLPPAPLWCQLMNALSPGVIERLSERNENESEEADERSGLAESDELASNEAAMIASVKQTLQNTVSALSASPPPPPSKKHDASSEVDKDDEKKANQNEVKIEDELFDDDDNESQMSNELAKTTEKTGTTDDSSILGKLFSRFTKN